MCLESMGRENPVESIAEPLSRSDWHNTPGEGCMGVGESKVGLVDERRSTGDHDAAVLWEFQLGCVWETRDGTRRTASNR